jgi:hypothetical protein
VHTVLAPRPTRREIRHDRLAAVLWFVLLVHDEVIKYPIIGTTLEYVASSWIDMLAGLSQW